MTSNSFKKILPPINIQLAAKENKNNDLHEITIRVIGIVSCQQGNMELMYLKILSNMEIIKESY